MSRAAFHHPIAAESGLWLNPARKLALQGELWQGVRSDLIPNKGEQVESGLGLLDLTNNLFKSFRVLFNRLYSLQKNRSHSHFDGDALGFGKTTQGLVKFVLKLQRWVGKHSFRVLRNCRPIVNIASAIQQPFEAYGQRLSQLRHYLRTRLCTSRFISRNLGGSYSTDLREISLAPAMAGSRLDKPVSQFIFHFSQSVINSIDKS